MGKLVEQVDLGKIGAINKNLNYSGQATDGSDLNDLDILMRQILAYTHSAWNYSDNMIKQNVTGKKTFAAIASGGTLYVAHNAGMVKEKGRLPTDEELNTIADIISREISDIPSYKLKKVTMINLATTNKEAMSFHAEMQLLAYCAKYNIQIDGRMLGVSKPCCANCASQLDAQGIIYSLKAHEAIGNWGIPESYTNLSVSTNSIYPI